MFVIKNEKINKLNILKQEFNDIIIDINIYTLMDNGDKIGKNNTGYYIFPSTYYQQLSRWWYDENRNKTLIYLNKDFNRFEDMINNIIMFLDDNKHHKSIFNNINEFIKKTVIKFINKLIIGLYNLKLTYNDSEPIKKKIDEVIIMLLNFKSRHTSILERIGIRYTI